MANYQAETRRAAERYGLDPNIFSRQIRQESGFNPNVTSGAGAIGIAQIMPGTARGWGVDPHDPIASLDAAAKHMAGYVKQFGSYRNALIAYNAGPGAVGKSLPAETQGYLRTILGGSTPSTTGVGGSSSQQPSILNPQAAKTPQLLDAGQSSDFTSLLGSLLAKPQPAQPSPSPIQAPTFAAGPKLPQGGQLLQPTASPAPQQQDKFASALSLVGALGGSGPTLGPDQATGAAQTGSVQPTGSVTPSAGTGGGADAALGWAKSKIGFKETGTNSGGLASYANSRFGMSGQPWCAMFTSLAVTKGGAPKSARTASVATVRAKAQRHDGYQGFVDPNSAQAGDLILFGNEHIGMVDHVSGGKVFYVGGNQSNGVTEASVPVGHGDIVRPKYAR